MRRAKRRTAREEMARKAWLTAAAKWDGTAHVFNPFERRYELAEWYKGRIAEPMMAWFGSGPVWAVSRMILIIFLVSFLAWAGTTPVFALPPLRQVSHTLLPSVEAASHQWDAADNDAISDMMRRRAQSDREGGWIIGVAGVFFALSWIARRLWTWWRE